MRLHRRARPRLYADAIHAAVTAASRKAAILDVAAEAKRIAKATGFSPNLTARDLVEAGIAARIDMTWGDTILLGRGRCSPMVSRCT
jgi:hypothetical protein